MPGVKIISIRSRLQHIDWQLFIFLLLFLNVKMGIKIAALVLLLLLNRKMFRDKSIYRQKFIWFYFSMIVIAVINLLLNMSSLSTNYLIAVSVGVVFWLMCVAAAFLSFWFVSKTDTAKLHTTITLFFVLNIVVTIGQLLLIMWHARAVNPYTYQGMHQKYFMGTGDMMTGVTLDVSTTNALLNAFGIVYFLSRNKMNMVLLSMTGLLLTASNFTNILLAVVLLFLFIFQSTRDQKSVILVCFFLLVIFMIKISPQNNYYVTGVYKKMVGETGKPAATKDNIPPSQKPDNIADAEKGKQKIAILDLDSLSKVRREALQKEGTPIEFKERPFIPKPDINTDPFQRARDTSSFQKGLLVFALKMLPGFDSSLRQTMSVKWPGKLIAFQQTFRYLKNHPQKIFTGSGMGNFASKLAFRATGLKMAGSYPEKFTYINNDFLNNHLSLYLTYFSRDTELHSLTNSPDSEYDQLIAEYGLAGVVVFMIFYLAFFVKRVRNLTYGVPLLLLLLGAFCIDYWYEQLSIVILFELLILLNIKEIREQK